MDNKNKELFLVSTLRVFFLLFCSSFIIRLIGFDKFHFDIDNRLLIKSSAFIYKYNLMSFVTLSYSSFVMLKLICTNKNNKVYYILSITSSVINIFLQHLIDKFYNTTPLYTIVSIVILLLSILMIDRKIPFKKTIIVFGLNILYQMICVFIRNINYMDRYMLIYELLLNIDYIIMLTISYIIYCMKGSESKCLEELKVVGSFLPLRISSRKSVKGSQKQSLSKNQSEEEKVSEIIYLILSLIWNIFTLATVIFVCTLNTSFITTVFLLSSFMITKTTFGEAFHMKSALSCFIVSNLTYFALSRITVSVNISFFIPIILGVGLSYVTSLLVRNNNVELYRGMDEGAVREICTNKNLNKYEIDLLVDFYSNKMSLVKLALKYSYSKDTIFIHKKKAIQKIKGEL